MLGLILIMEDAAMIDLLVICVVIWLRRTKLEVRAFRYFLREGYWDCNYCVINNVEEMLFMLKITFFFIKTIQQNRTDLNIFFGAFL